MIETLLGFLIAIISLVVGYFLGRNDFSGTKDTITKTRQIVEDVFKGRPDVGVVERPDPHELRRITDPKFADEEDAMIKQFEELQNRKAE